jgi:hypothetical protein
MLTADEEYSRRGNADYSVVARESKIMRYREKGTPELALSRSSFTLAHLERLA